jgi:hypothetical protein
MERRNFIKISAPPLTDSPVSLFLSDVVVQRLALPAPEQVDGDVPFIPEPLIELEELGWIVHLL